MTVDAVRRGGGDGTGVLLRLDVATRVLAESRDLSEIKEIRDQAEAMREARPRLPRGSGIYFVFDGDELRYVGISHNMRRRWTGHHRIRQFEGFAMPLLAWKELPFDQAVAAEKNWIARHPSLVNARPLPFEPREPTQSQKDFMSLFFSDRSPREIFEAGLTFTSEHHE